MAEGRSAGMIRLYLSLLEVVDMSGWEVLECVSPNAGFMYKIEFLRGK